MSEHHDKDGKKSFWKSFKRGWKSSEPTRKAEIVILAIGAIGAIGYLVAYIIVSVRQDRMVVLQHSPNVIFSRAPEFLQGFACDPNHAAINSGNMQVFVKNVGNAKAANVFIALGFNKVIPNRRRSDPFLNAIPVTDCKSKMSGGSSEFPLAIGEEKGLAIRQSMGASTLQLDHGETVQVYSLWCVYYSAEFGNRHATCDTFRIFVPSDSPLDRLSGTPEFMCDGVPRIGTFRPAPTGHCSE
jgi:hypothetical protein